MISVKSRAVHYSAVQCSRIERNTAKCKELQFSVVPAQPVAASIPDKVSKKVWGLIIHIFRLCGVATVSYKLCVAWQKLAKVDKKYI